MTEPFLRKNASEKTTTWKSIGGKRGQVTTFAIIGLLIVVLGLGVYLLKDRIFAERLELKDIEVPVQAESVKDFVTICIEDTLKDASVKIRNQGGYINLPGDPINVGEFSNSLFLFKNNKVVFWSYIADNNVLYEQRPNLEFMAKEISDYVDNNLKRCLGSFNEYDNFKIKQGRIKTEAEIQDDRTIVKVIFPIEIEKGNFEFKFNEFYAQDLAPLGSLFRDASKIYFKEEDELFLEKKTLEIMSVYKEIPYVGETNDCIAPVWIKEQVIKDFKEILRENIGAYKVKGTDYVLKNDKDKYLEIDADVDDKELNVNFLFSENWPFELKIIPEDDGLLKGYSVTEALGEARGIAESFVCLSTYEFVYNVKYPVLVVMNKKGYSFQYAMMAHIDRNEPRKNEEEFFSFDQYDQRFCNEQIDFVVDTVDTSFSDLNNVRLQYKCINHVCDLGESRNGIWKGKVPLCVNGAFIGNKEGYHLGKYPISTNQEGSALVVLEPLRNISVEVLVERGGSGELREGEKAYVSLREEDKEFNKFILYPDQKSVQLIPGFYTGKIYFVSKHPGLDIPEKTFRHCADVPKGALGGIFGVTEEKCEDVTIPGTNVDQIVTGTDEFEFFISEENLRAKKIRFYAPYFGVINDISELGNLTKQEGRLPEFL